MGSALLAGDIGGTKTVIATFESNSNGLEMRRESSFAAPFESRIEIHRSGEVLGHFRQQLECIFEVGGSESRRAGRSLGVALQRSVSQFARASIWARRNPP